MNQKYKWLVWAIVFLLVLNVATLTTIIYHNYKQEKQSASPTVASAAGTNVVNGRFFKQNLGFTNEQMDKFRQANQQFRPHTEALTFSIDSMKNKMFREMKKEQPDTSRLNVLSAKIGELHGQLKRQTYEFYLRLKSVCSDQQLSELDKVFQPLFINDNFQPGAGRSKRGWHKAGN
ncbi:MAG: hypothetical protein ACM3VS_13285 [Candidatus Dadabacteria bacterium]